MIIIPAIDLMSGKCVRLQQGDFKQQQIFHDNSLTVAREFAEAGAEYLHVVDLDGAKQQAMQQHTVIANLVQNTRLKIQVGGGIRTAQQITELLALGVYRVVVGSKAITAVEEVQHWFEQFGADKIVLAVDVSLVNEIPLVKIHGWQQQLNVSLWEVLDNYPNLKHLLCTDIARDGVLAGPNFALYQEIIQRFPHIQLQASGGVSSESDVQRLAKNNVSAVIIGKALYSGHISLTKLLGIYHVS